MKQPLLSICIPTYNRASLLKGLIENIFSEIGKSGNGADVQIVIVDGGSEDNTSEIIQKLTSTGEIKYYRREKKEGIDKDILKCIEIAAGEYCWLFSDDDRFSTGAINYLLNTLRKERDLTGCFCNRKSYDFKMEREVAEARDWPGKSIKEDHIFTDKAECFKRIGMDLGFISSQVVKRSSWQEIVEGESFGDLSNSCYLMVHIIGRMMDKKFKWLYISKPMVKQRTGNDSFLKSRGVIERQMIEHNSFEKVLNCHYSSASEEYKIFFSKMVNRLPRVIANLKSQGIDYKIQFRLFKLYHAKYSHYQAFWFKVVPVFFPPNVVFSIIKKIYFKYWITIVSNTKD